jgi:hypothetical protein
MINKIKKVLISISVLLPMTSYAVLDQTERISTAGLDIINRFLIPIAFSLALLYFFYGVAKYIRSAGSDKDEGRKIMVWGVVALFVMSSVWGLVYFIRSEFGIINTDSPIKVPTAEK